MFNCCTIGGRITRDCENRFSQSGTCFASFTLAVERDYKNSDGKRDTDFIDCKLIGKRAESLAQYLTKGKPICVTGSLQIRSYEDNNGVKRKAAEIKVDKLSFLPDTKREGQADNKPPQNSGFSNGTIDFDEDSIPF